MREWGFDLHLHSVASPCASDEMTPPAVISRALAMGLEAIAITDHNTVENAAVFMAKGKEEGLRVFPGMELQTVEEVHLVCLFEDMESAFKWQEIVYEHLPKLENRTSYYGEQWVVDKEGLKSGEISRMLLIASSFTIEETVEAVHKLGGLCIAAHIDRQAFSLWGHLGVIPLDLPLDGVELTPHLPRSESQLESLRRQNITYLVSSDAHYLNDIKEPQTFAWMEKLSIEEIRWALKGQKGRYIRTAR
jgi:hypothetical protein